MYIRAILTLLTNSTPFGYNMYDVCVSITMTVNEPSITNTSTIYIQQNT